MQKRTRRPPSFTLQSANFDEGAGHLRRSDAATSDPGGFLPEPRSSCRRGPHAGWGAHQRWGQREEGGKERDEDFAGGRKALSKAWPATSHRSPCSLAGPVTPACSRPATLHWCVWHTVASYVTTLPPRDSLPAKKRIINHPAAVSVEKSNSRFPCHGWQSSKGAPQPCEQGGRCQGPGVRRLGAGGPSHSDLRASQSPGLRRSPAQPTGISPAQTSLRGPCGWAGPLGH